VTTPAVPQPATRSLAERFAAHAGIEAPEGMILGWRTVHPDLRSNYGYRWTFPGGWATDPREGVDLAPSTAPNEPCPHEPCSRYPSGLGGVCIAVTARGAASGSIPMRTVLLTAHHPADVLGASPDKLRVARALVLDVVDVSAAARGADLGGADLGGADLRYADLGGADLRYADLGGADLGGADLRYADLGGADLGGADLGGADLRYADLGGADLRGADLGGADLRGANLRGSAGSQLTLWPNGFDHVKAGVMIR
jgi:hypothetical protein